MKTLCIQDFIYYHLMRGIYFFLLLFPALVCSVLAQYLNEIPSWAILSAVIILVLYLIYAGIWSTKAANLLTFQDKSFVSALCEARIQTNVDIAIKLSFLPLIDRLFYKEDNSENDNTEFKGS